MPYSLLLLDKSDANAFSYGFGGKGAGGIVLFTGILDAILSESADPPPPRRWQDVFSSPSNPRPSAKQDMHLATILAHEMGHLMLSHHLESLSQQQVLWPSFLNFTMDIVRGILWPVT